MFPQQPKRPRSQEQIKEKNTLLGLLAKIMQRKRNRGKIHTMKNQELCLGKYKVDTEFSSNHISFPPID